MKFGKQLKVESVPEWQEHYMSYKRLKRIIKKLVLETKSAQPLNNNSESRPLLPDSLPNDSSIATMSDSRKEFFAVLENDIDKVNRFFRAKQSEFELQLSAAEESVKEFEPVKVPDSVTLTVPTAPLSPSRAKSIADRCSRLLEFYRSLLQLQSFSVLNFEGLRKILKKLDKNIGESHQEIYVARMKKEPFQDTARLNAIVQSTEAIFIRMELVRGGSAESAALALKSVVKEMNTPKEEDLNEGKYVYLWLFLSIFLALLFYFLPIFPESEIRAHKCLSLMAFVTVLWVTEAVPFFVASLSIPLIVITAGILADPLTGLPLTAERAARVAFAAMFNDTIMLVLGGFSISAAFSKCQFELQLASFIQRLFGDRPRLFLLAFMFLGAFLSMWISNVAAPVLLTSLLLPIVRDFGSSNQYARALLIGLAFSCNIGGMMSPISSPQNAIALGYLETAEPDRMISFGQWLLVSIPFCSVAVLISWLYLIFVFLRSEDSIPQIPTIVFEKTKLTKIHLITMGISIITILLWCSLTYTRPVLADIGTVAFLPVFL